MDLPHKHRPKRGYGGTRIGPSPLKAKSYPVLMTQGPRARGLIDPVRLEGLAVNLGDDNFAFGLIDTVWLKGLTLYLGDDYFAFGLIDTLWLEELPVYLGDDYFAFGLIDTVWLEGLAVYLDDFYTSPSSSSTQFGSRGSATNPGQEELWRDHGGLARPGGQVLPGARERRPKGVAGFSTIKTFCFDYVDYTEDGPAASTAGKRNRLLRILRLYWLQQSGPRLQQGSISSEDVNTRVPRIRSHSRWGMQRSFRGEDFTDYEACLAQSEELRSTFCIPQNEDKARHKGGWS
jgi:hypothetical protein